MRACFLATYTYNHSLVSYFQACLWSLHQSWSISKSLQSYSNSSSWLSNVVFVLSLIEEDEIRWIVSVYLHIPEKIRTNHCFSHKFIFTYSEFFWWKCPKLTHKPSLVSSFLLGCTHSFPSFTQEISLLEKFEQVLHFIFPGLFQDAVLFLF